MSRSDDAKPAMERTGYLGGFSPEVRQWLAFRSAYIYAGTQRRRMPDTYGRGDGPVGPVPFPAKKGKRDG